MPGCVSDAAGSFFVFCVREPLERDDVVRGRDDDRVLDAMRLRYPRGATPTGGDTRRQSGAVVLEPSAEPLSEPPASGGASFSRCRSGLHDDTAEVIDSIVEGTATENSTEHAAIASQRLADGTKRGFDTGLMLRLEALLSTS